MAGGRLEGDPARRVEGVAGLSEAGAKDVSFIAQATGGSSAESQAACLVVPQDWSGEPGPGQAVLRVAEPNRAISRIAEALLPPSPVPEPGVHPQAVVASSAVLGADVHVGPCAVVGEGVWIGDRSRIRAGAVVEAEAVIGSDCDLHPCVVVCPRVRLGNRVVVHAGTVIGSDGFGYLSGEAGPEKIPQLGTVEIGDDAEVGACVTIDRARFGVTRIGPRVKIDNLVQIGHNVTVGEGSILVSQVGVAGSTRIGRGCVIAGRAAIDGHLDIGDGARVGGMAGVTKDVPPDTDVSGFPAIPHHEELRRQAGLRRMREVLDRVEAIEKRLTQVEQAGGDG
jgi:UDP-3-O-[3-hydroxymyristoyl] glucosamine N-acyltransferase